MYDMEEGRVDSVAERGGWVDERRIMRAEVG